MAVVKIDGQDKRVTRADVLELLPGRHSLQIEVSKVRALTKQYTNDVTRWLNPVVFDFTYDAGQLYYLRMQKDPETFKSQFIAHNVTHWPEVSFLFEQYLKNRSTHAE